MATNVDLRGNWAFFTNGVQNNNRRYVGHDTSGNAVIRYHFRTPAAGANSLSWKQTRATAAYGTPGGKLRFYVGDDPNSHINAGPEADYHGEDTPTGSGYLTVGGSISGLTLLPDKDYYLFIFPGFSSYCLYGWDYQYEEYAITVTLDGAAGVVRLKEGDQELIAVPMVKEGGELVQLAATVKSGDDLIFCV
jgi:hypothetical protein